MFVCEQNYKTTWNEPYTLFFIMYEIPCPGHNFIQSSAKGFIFSKVSYIYEQRERKGLKCKTNGLNFEHVVR